MAPYDVTRSQWVQAQFMQAIYLEEMPRLRGNAEFRLPDYRVRQG